MKAKKEQHKAPTPSNDHATAPLPPQKARVFWIVLIASPFIIIILLELTLRAFNYGQNIKLVIDTTVNGQAYHTLNRQGARRFFFQQGITLPEMTDNYFEIEKGANTKRIFMLGESTMEGFPYEYNATAPSLYLDRLRQLLPQYNVEVINVGLSAVNSYTVLDFIKELVQYQPDGFIVYLGHNEFYGALGIGSTEYLGQSRSLVNLYLSLESYRTFMLLRNVISSLRTSFSSSVTPRQPTLMAAMVGNKTIPYHSREYDIAMKNFEGNLYDIAGVAKEHSVPIVFCTVASNIRDQKPFVPIFDSRTTSEQKDRWNSSYASGLQFLGSMKYDNAATAFQQCIAIDSMNANAFYYLGQSYDSLHRYSEAKTNYERARDLDGLRFRASTECNQLIRNFAMSDHVLLCDIEKAFEDSSPHGLVGKSLMLEHLHPNIPGYFLLAKTFYQTTYSSSFLVPRDQWHMERNLSDSEYMSISGITDFDRECGNYMIFQLTNNWPFRTSPDSNATYHVQGQIGDFVMRYVHHTVFWSKVRYDLAEWLKDHNRFEEAKNEYYAVWKIVPDYYFPLMEMGDVYRLMNKPHSAESLYNRANLLQKSPYIDVRLGMLYFDEDKPKDAIVKFENIFSNNNGYTEEMTTKERSMALYFLGASYGKSGDITKAKDKLRQALLIDPSNTQAQTMLSRIP